MVKKILNDLEISSIKLITNNPSKLSDISKLGIKITERIPITSKPNKHNKFYIKTKKEKFKHLQKNNCQYYFHQFHVDELSELNEIIDFMKNKNKDPFLKICVGINTNSYSIKNQKEVEKINKIAKHCKQKSEFIPVLHHSFNNNHLELDDIAEIKKNFPEINRLQINDFKELKIDSLEKYFNIFEIDIPLDNDNFKIIYNKKFREIIKKKNSFIILDNSKGKGLKEPKESMMKKINILLSYGLNNIVLCGGFGPDQLHTYFEARRYYRFNFSIDAESNLKTNGKIDTCKIKHYLTQLIRFDDPKYDGIEQTKKFLIERSDSDWSQTKIQGHDFSIHPKVFHAGHFPSTAWFANELCDLLKNNSNFCEIGCGAGVISCLAALSNPNLQVIATDINPYATQNTQMNADRLHLNSRISAFTGDVLDSIDPKLCFDSIFWALPFGFLDPGTPINMNEAQFFDPGYKSIRKLLQTAKQYLKPNGKVFLGFSSDLGHYELLQDLAKEVHASVKIIAKTTIQEDIKLQFEILELLYGESEKIDPDKK